MIELLQVSAPVARDWQRGGEAVLAARATAAYLQIQTSTNILSQF